MHSSDELDGTRPRSSAYQEPDRAARQRIGVDYLRAQALDAHRNGDGVLVNHLAALALQHAMVSKSGGRECALPDCYWAIVLALYWLIDDHMLDLAESSLNEMCVGSDAQSSELARFCDHAVKLMRQVFNDGTECVEALTDAELLWVSEPVAKRPEAVVLLTLLIELVWYRDRDSRRWQTMAAAWCKRLERRVRTAERALRPLVDRLDAQLAIVCPGTPFWEDDRVRGKLGGKQADVYTAWRHYATCAWEDLDHDIERIVSSLGFGSPAALSMFHLHRQSFGLHSQRQMEPQEIGLTRRRVHMAGGKAAVFAGMRDAAAAEAARKLGRTRAETKGARHRWTCFRLAMLGEIAALRAWDIGAWHAAVHEQCEANLELTRLDSDPRFAIEAVRLAVQSHSFDTKDQLLVTALLSLDLAPERFRRTLVEGLLQNRPIDWPSVLSVWQVLSDAIPWNQLQDVARWCTEYMSKESRLRGWSLGWLSFWADVFPYLATDDGTWEVIRPCLEAAPVRALWLTQDALLRSYLRSAPLPDAVAFGRRMMAVPNPDEPERQARWRILYNAVVGREDLAEHFRGWLVEQADTPVDRHFCFFLEHRGASAGPRKDEALRQWFRERLTERVASVLNRKAGEPVGFGGSPFHDIARVKWPPDDRDLVGLLVEGVEHPAAQAWDIADFIHYIAHLVMGGGADYASEIEGKLYGWLDAPPAPTSPISSDGGPLSTFHVTFPGDEAVLSALCHLAVQVVGDLGKPAAERMGDWLWEFVFERPLEAANVLVYLVARSAIALGGRRGEALMSGLHRVFACAESGPPKAGRHPLVSALAGVVTVLEAKAPNDIRELAQGEAQGAVRLLLKILSGVLPAASRHSDPAVRARAAAVLARWDSAFGLPSALEDCRDQLAQDARARVRHEITREAGEAEQPVE